ncbi:MAG: TetR family transcriptional regulator [Sandaracinus sp.]|nr:TetR family transcriptional regulator [Sandaracinus sp.]MCB9617129.1 TetR family transcriptional regulator [Sandaracinus sp.]MCB9634619.1 TetR family transcriptional regulator [Sandaracinus sp.]
MSERKKRASAAPPRASERPSKRSSIPPTSKTPAKAAAKSTKTTKATSKRAPSKRAAEAPPRKRTKLPPERPGRPGGIRARNRDVRIAALLDASLKLFLERGVEAVSIDEIAREAGMAKGNFYRYFDDKRAIVDHLLAPVATEVRTAMRKCAVSLGRASDPSAMGLAYAMLAMELAQATTSRLDVVRLYLQENRTPATTSTAGVRALADELSDGAVKLTEAAVERGLLEVSDPRVSGLAVVGAIEQLALSVLRGQLDAPPLEVGRIVVSMVLDGIRVR